MSHLGTENAFGHWQSEEIRRRFKPQGKHLTYLQIGEPGFNTPENINQAAIRAPRIIKRTTPDSRRSETAGAVARKHRKKQESPLPEDV